MTSTETKDKDTATATNEAKSKDLEKSTEGGKVPATKNRPLSDVSKGSPEEKPKPEDPLYVPVTNLNYRPEGAGVPQGYVPDTPGDDKTLIKMRESLKAQGEVAGEDVEPPTEEAKKAIEDEIKAAQSNQDQQDNANATDTKESDGTGADLPGKHETKR